MLILLVSTLKQAFDAEIVLQETNNRHTVLFLLHNGNIKQKIDFDREDDASSVYGVGMNLRGETKMYDFDCKVFNREAHPNITLIQGDYDTLSGFLEKMKKTVEEINDEQLEFSSDDPYAFNCRAGINACLRSVGFSYIDPNGFNELERNGMQARIYDFVFSQ